MRVAAVLVCLSFLAPQVDKVTLQYYQDSIVLRQGDAKEVVPLELPKEKPPLSVLYRRNKSYAVWDDRGLSVRYGKRIVSSHLPEVATSPRIFARDEIVKTIALIRQGKRKKNANGLSGSRRIGNTAYFLVRWDDSDRKPWLEVLMSVDLTDPKAKPKLVAKLPGRSLATRPIDSQLVVIEGRLTAVAQKGDAWGMASFDPTLKLFVFNRLGEKLKSYTPINARLGAFVEGTDYGALVAGRVDLVTRTRKTLAESKGSVKFLDGLDPLLVVVTRGETVTVINTVTAAEVRLPASSALRRTSRGVAVWSPYKAPKHAWLYDPARWDLRAEWPETPESGGTTGR
jgi:hypothetical protein